MTDHAVARYTVKVHPKHRPKERYLLGAVGKNNKSLFWALKGYLDVLNEESEDKRKTVKLRGSVDADEKTGELYVPFDVGIRGQRLDITDGNNVLLRQQEAHASEVRAAALFHLPPDSDLGHVSIYVPHRRSATSLLFESLVRDFEEDFETDKLKFEAAIEGSVLKAAVSQGRLDRVILERYDKSSDAADGTNKWVAQGAAADVRLEIRSRKGFRLVTGKIKAFLDGADDELDGILEFEGVSFERAKVEVDLGNGKSRTFNIEKPESGHPMTQDIGAELSFNDQGWPTKPSMQKALRANVAGAS